MKGRFERHRLPLADPFGIARRTSETTEAVVVELSHDGNRGVGGVTPSAYYGESADSVASILPELIDAATDPDDPHAIQRASERMDAIAPDAPAARAAVETARHDLAARDLGVPLYRQWGLDPDATPRTSYTVGIDDPGRMAEKAAAVVAEGFPILKVKLGTDDDRTRFEAVREAAPEATIRVDANGAWDAEEALRRILWLADAGVELVEQPVPGTDIAALHRVSEGSSIPVCADESCVDAAAVPRVAHACDAVTVKLTKCGGLRQALRQIHVAHAHGLDAMLGCMVESNASIAPACHLAPLVEYADLDGALLLAEDPFDGVPIRDGEIALSNVEVGTGARRRD